MKRIALAVLCASLALPAVAQEGPSKGCYMRDYTDSHLAKHPRQVVDWIILHVDDDDYGNRYAGIRVKFANQGHVMASGHGGRIMDQYLICWRDGGKAFCGVECDGGVIEFTRDDRSGVLFRTQGVMIGEVDGCGGITDLAEIPGQYVSYKLNRVSDAQCNGL